MKHIAALLLILVLLFSAGCTPTQPVSSTEAAITKPDAESANISEKQSEKTTDQWEEEAPQIQLPQYAGFWSTAQTKPTDSIWDYHTYYLCLYEDGTAAEYGYRWIMFGAWTQDSTGALTINLEQCYSSEPGPGWVPTSLGYEAKYSYRTETQTLELSKHAGSEDIPPLNTLYPCSFAQMPTCAELQETVSNITIASTEYTDPVAFAKMVRQKLLDEAWTSLAPYIAYPLKLGDTVYNNSDELLHANLTGVLSQDFLSRLEAETCEDMPWNWKGYMLSNGLVWISEFLTSTGETVMRVTAINL